MTPTSCVWIDWSMPLEQYALLLLALREYGADGQRLAEALERHAKHFGTELPREVVPLPDWMQ